MSNEVEMNPWNQALAAQLTGRNGGLLPGEELWCNHNKMNIHHFRATVSEATKRGEILPVTPVIEKKYGAYCVVIRLKHPRKVWPWWMAGTAVALGWVVITGAWLWNNRGPIAVVGGLALLAVIWNRVHHSGACSGLHCAGCRR